MRPRFGINEHIAAFFLIFALMGITACSRHQELRLKTYVNNAVGLRKGAAVRVQGVELGKVTAVTVRSDGGKPPVEIDMVLQPNYDLRIPADAKVHLETQGVLGPTFVEIDLAGTSGSPVASNGVLRAQEQPQVSLEQVVDKLAESVRKPCKDGGGSAIPLKVPATRR